MLIGGGVIVKVFLISPLHLVRLRTLSGFVPGPALHLVRVRTRPRVLCPCAQLVRVRTRPRVLYPRALPIRVRSRFRM